MALRIYLEMKPVSISGAGHMYLVLRDDRMNNLVGNPADKVVRGTAPEPLGFVGPLGTTTGLLSDTLDAYREGDTPIVRNSVDITDAIGGVSKWTQLEGYARDIRGSFPMGSQVEIILPILTPLS